MSIGNAREIMLLYRMLKATIYTIGKVPGNYQMEFIVAETEFLRLMHDENREQKVEPQ